MKRYDCVIVGGGIAGLQAAIQLGRYQHSVLVIDNENGRSNLCRGYHNILGWPDGISGPVLRNIGRRQAEQLGVGFAFGEAERIGGNRDEGFTISLSEGMTYQSRHLLIATGIMDRIPILEQVRELLGVTIYVCPDCDGYEIRGHRTVVLGAGDVGAEMALTLHYFSHEITYVNHEEKPVSEKLLERLQEASIRYVKGPVEEVRAVGSQLESVFLRSGETISAERGFVAFGGNEVKSTLLHQLGAKMLRNRHVLTHPRTRMTSIQNVWAAGDVVAHSEQVTIAMGEGSQCAIWMHKSLLGQSVEPFQG